MNLNHNILHLYIIILCILVLYYPEIRMKLTMMVMFLGESLLKSVTVHYFI